MSSTRHLMIVSSGQVYRWALQRAWEHEPAMASWRISTAADVGGLAGASDVELVVFVPRLLEEMIRLLPYLEERKPAHPSLILGDLRLPGSFVTHLDREQCTLVGTGASAEELETTIGALLEKKATAPVGVLEYYFAKRAVPLLTQKPVMLPSPKEYEIGCATSLHLTNREIASMFHVGYGTVKWHTHNLMSMLHVKPREALGTLFERAFVPVARAS